MPPTAMRPAAFSRPRAHTQCLCLRRQWEFTGWTRRWTSGRRRGISVAARRWAPPRPSPATIVPHQDDTRSINHRHHYLLHQPMPYHSSRSGRSGSRLNMTSSASSAASRTTNRGSSIRRCSILLMASLGAARSIFSASITRLRTDHLGGAPLERAAHHDGDRDPRGDHREHERAVRGECPQREWLCAPATGHRELPRHSLWGASRRGLPAVGPPGSRGVNG
jgi:hypothetical protein